MLAHSHPAHTLLAELPALVSTVLLDSAKIALRCGLGVRSGPYSERDAGEVSGH